MAHSSTGHIFPPRPSDQRIKDLIAIHGGSSGRSVQDDVREAMALAIGQTATYAITTSVDDMWLEFKEFMGIGDDDFDADALLASILTEDGLSFIAKEDGAAIIQE